MSLTKTNMPPPYHQTSKRKPRRSFCATAIHEPGHAVAAYVTARLIDYAWPLIESVTTASLDRRTIAGRELRTIMDAHEAAQGLRVRWATAA